MKKVIKSNEKEGKFTTSEYLSSQCLQQPQYFNSIDVHTLQTEKCVAYLLTSQRTFAGHHLVRQCCFIFNKLYIMCYVILCMLILLYIVNVMFLLI